MLSGLPRAQGTTRNGSWNLIMEDLKCQAKEFGFHLASSIMVVGGWEGRKERKSIYKICIIYIGYISSYNLEKSTWEHAQNRLE